MRIPIDHYSVIPMYRQIETFFRKAIQSGTLLPDMRLPASRKLAEDLGISRITIENAYAELKADGLITSRVGSGTYVLPLCPLSSLAINNSRVTWPLWQQDLVIGKEIITGKVMSKRQKIIQHLISLAAGSGDPRLFPVEDFRRTIQSVIRRDGITAFEYGEPSGFTRLRVSIGRVLASQGLHTQPENILITSGSQQALALVSQLLLKPGDVILVESPTYARALDLFRTLDLKIVGIPLDHHGMQVEKLEELLQQLHPKLIYTIPNFQNPTGVSMNSWRRRRLIALADRYNVPILEDDFVGDLRYEGRAQPSLKALDPGGRVIYTSTFSKMLLPGLRIGFVVAEGPVYQELVRRKHTYDLASSNLIQRVLDSYLTIGRYQTHLRYSCRIYRKRRDTMLKAIKLHLPADISVTSPRGGFFIWLCLPENISAKNLLPLASEEGVIYAPGNSFFPNGSGGDNYLRLNFAANPPEEIEEGVKRLGKAIKRLRQYQ